MVMPGMTRHVRDVAEVPSQPCVPDELHRIEHVRDHAGIERRWHLLDSGPWLAERGITPRGTLLAVHGNPTFSFLFRSLVREDLPWRLIAVDQLEMGWSERTGTVRHLQDRITDLSLLTDALSLRGPVVTIGHDWGGIVSVGWALDNRHDVAGMVLTNTGIHQQLGEQLPAALRLATAPAVLPATTSLTDAFLRTTLSLSQPPLPREVQDAYLAPYRGRVRRRGIEDFVADIPDTAGHPSRPTLERLAEGIKELDVPTFFAWGPRDITFSDRYLRDLIARVPHAAVHRFEGTSHLVWEDADVAGTLAAWLAETFDEHGAPRAERDARPSPPMPSRPPAAPSARPSPASPPTPATPTAPPSSRSAPRTPPAARSPGRCCTAGWRTSPAACSPTACGPATGSACSSPPVPTSPACSTPACASARSR